MACRVCRLPELADTQTSVLSTSPQDTQAQCPIEPVQLLTVTPRQTGTVGGNAGACENGDDAHHQAGEDDIEDDNSYKDSGPSLPGPVAGMLYQQDYGGIDKDGAGLRVSRNSF